MTMPINPTTVAVTLAAKMAAQAPEPLQVKEWLHSATDVEDVQPRVLYEARPPVAWLGYLVGIILGMVAGGLALLAKWPIIAVMAAVGATTFIVLAIVDKISHRATAADIALAEAVSLPAIKDSLYESER